MRLLLTALVACLGLSQTADAGNILDRINKTIDTVESTMDTVDRTTNRAESTAEHLNTIAPASGAETEETLSAEEQEILHRAEAIKQKQSVKDHATRRSRRRY